jgi:hypothetical protein
MQLFRDGEKLGNCHAIKIANGSGPGRVGARN